MTTQRRALKEGVGGPAACVERHNDVGWTVRTLVRIRDGVSTFTEDAGMTFERFPRAREAFFNGKPRALIGASTKSGNQERAWTTRVTCLSVL
jgi:hypothetical protein